MVVLACCPDDQELDPRWVPLLLSYNGLLASLTHNFLQLVRECCQAATAAPHSMTMMSAIKG